MIINLTIGERPNKKNIELNYKLKKTLPKIACSLRNISLILYLIAQCPEINHAFSTGRIEKASRERGIF